MLRVSAIDEFWDKISRDAFEIDAKLTHSNIPSQKLLVNTPKRTQEIANGRPDTFNGIGMNLSNPIGIGIYCPLPLTMANGGMTAVESQVAPDKSGFSTCHSSV